MASRELTSESCQAGSIKRAEKDGRELLDGEHPEQHIGKKGEPPGEKEMLEIGSSELKVAALADDDQLD